MTNIRRVMRRGLKWLLAGAAFVTVVAGASGCMTFCAGRCDAGDGGNRPGARGAWDGSGSGYRGAGEAGVINVFGEVGGSSPGAVRPVSEAGFQQHTRLEEGEDSGVVTDPTGRWMVYASTRHSEQADLYLQRVDGTAVTQLTSDAADEAFPAISPDGKRVAYCSTASGTWQIYVMDLDGKNATQVTNGRTPCVHPSFSPDGRRLAYSSLGLRSGQWELWTADVEGGERKMIGYGLFPSWCPRKDVDRIAYQRPRQRGSRWFSLWTLDLVDGEGRRPTEVAVSPVAAIVTPCWSPDGRRIAFATVVEPAEPNARGRRQQDVWVVDADGSNRQRLTDGSGSNLMPYWSRDGRVYFISDRDGRECVWSVKADAGQKTFTAGADDREVH